MDTDLVIAIFKTASPLFAGMLGIAALLVNYHNEAGKLTRGGYAVLTGIVVAALVGMATAVFEAQKVRTASQEQLARTETLLREVARAVQPITELRLIYWVEIPPGIPVVDAYIKRARAGIEARKASLSAMPPPVDGLKGLVGLALDVDRKLIDVIINPESDLWPAKDTPEEVLSILVSTFSLGVKILKEPVDPEKYEPWHGSGDFDANEIFPTGSHFSWDLKHQRLSMIVDEDIEKRFWNTSGKITSFVDLRGAQLLLFPSESLDIRIPELNDANFQERRKIMRTLNLRSFTMNLGEGRSLRIPGSKFKKSAYKGGEPVFSVTFPKTEKEFAIFFEEKDSD